MATRSKLMGAVLAGAGLAALPALNAAAAPQYGGSYQGGDQQVVRCESRDGRTQRCQTPGYARLARQLSDSPCIEGRNWGQDRGGVWVSGGCRADFVVSGYDDGYGGGYGPGPGQGSGGTFRCESRDGRYRQCDGGGGGRVSLVRQLSDSPCIQGRTWGRERGGVWVDRGCRGEFAVDRGWSGGGWDGGNQGGGYGQSLRCESRDARTQRCGANVRRGVQLVRQLSDSPCVEGRNWGWDRGGVWVSGGCRAEFRID